MSSKTTFIVGIMLASAGVIGPAGPANADTPHCVTRAEFNQVHRGISERLVPAGFAQRVAHVGRFPKPTITRPGTAADPSGRRS
jgi:hypothetical protein